MKIGSCIGDSVKGCFRRQQGTFLISLLFLIILFLPGCGGDTSSPTDKRLTTADELQARIVIGPQVVAVSEPVDIIVEVNRSAGTYVVSIDVDGQSLSVDANNSATYTPTSAGTYEVTVVVADDTDVFQGKERIIADDPANLIPPQAQTISGSSIALEGVYISNCHYSVGASTYVKLVFTVDGPFANLLAVAYAQNDSTCSSSMVDMAVTQDVDLQVTSGSQTVITSGWVDGAGNQTSAPNKGDGLGALSTNESASVLNVLPLSTGLGFTLGQSQPLFVVLDDTGQNTKLYFSQNYPDTNTVATDPVYTSFTSNNGQDEKPVNNPGNGSGPLQATANVTPNMVAPGELVTINVNVNNANGNLQVAAMVDGVPISLDQNNSAAYTSQVTGSHSVYITVEDADEFIEIVETFVVQAPNVDTGLALLTISGATVPLSGTYISNCHYSVGAMTYLKLALNVSSADATMSADVYTSTDTNCSGVLLASDTVTLTFQSLNAVVSTSGWIDALGNTSSPPQRGDGSGSLSDAESATLFEFTAQSSGLAFTQGNIYSTFIVVDDSGPNPILYFANSYPNNNIVATDPYYTKQ